MNLTSVEPQFHWQDQRESYRPNRTSPRYPLPRNQSTDYRFPGCLESSADPTSPIFAGSFCPLRHLIEGAGQFLRQIHLEFELEAMVKVRI
jgi:hypothetical protein